MKNKEVQETPEMSSYWYSTPGRNFWPTRSMDDQLTLEFPIVESAFMKGILEEFREWRRESLVLNASKSNKNTKNFKMMIDAPNFFGKSFIGLELHNFLIRSNIPTIYIPDSSEWCFQKEQNQMKYFMEHAAHSLTPFWDKFETFRDSDKIA